MIEVSSDPNAYRRWYTLRLGVAVRFVDAFSSETVVVPLGVSIPSQGWEAIRRQADATYRFVCSERPVPGGTFDVAVEAPGGEYTNHQTIQITLPVVPSVAPPPVMRGDYLVEHPLWPTRRFRVPAGETAVIGRLVSTASNPVAGLEVRMFPVGDPPPPMPFARSDAQGEFLFRLPWFKRRMTGTSISPPPDVEVRVAGTGGPISPVSPAQFTPDIGRTQVRVLAIP